MKKRKDNKITKKPDRDANLDLIRATAILLVLAYHIISMWPVENSLIRKISSFGRHGVDLFFVLSGFLVGGLYFRELRTLGRVHNVSFWLRRALRTIPPYFVALLLVYSSVRFVRGDAFDLSYLWFGQNYRLEMPYFWASWSLCVEEHAYIFMVLVLGLLVATKIILGVSLLLICFSAALMPLFDSAIRGLIGWDPRKNATHLWYGGIAFGILASWIQVYRASLWGSIQRASRFIWPIPLTFACYLSWAGGSWLPWLPFTMAFACIVLLAACAGKAPLPGSTTRIVRAIAISSYSAYLVHGLIIHIGKYLKSKFPLVPDLIMAGVWIGIIILSTGVFYFCVERTSIHMRDRLIPRPNKTV